MDKRNEGLVAYTQNKREATLKAVQDAINSIKASGRPVRRKDILEESGVSSAVLSKPYVKELLKQNQVLMYESQRVSTTSGTAPYKSLARENENIRKQLDKVTQQLQDKMQLIETKNRVINDLHKEIADKDAQWQMLSGKYQYLLEYLYRNGMSDEQIEKLFKY